MKQKTEKQTWYVLRVTYNRELKLKDKFKERGIECFVPMRYVEKTSEGRTERKLTSAIACLIFVHATRNTLDALKGEFEYTLPFRYLINKATHKPMVVREKEMLNFIAVAGNEELTQYVQYLGVEAQHLKRGEEVIIRAGNFKGIEGRIVRVKRQRRVLVELQGIATVVTAYIPNELLERKKERNINTY